LSIDWHHVAAVKLAASHFDRGSQLFLHNITYETLCDAVKLLCVLVQQAIAVVDIGRWLMPLATVIECLHVIGQSLAQYAGCAVVDKEGQHFAWFIDCHLVGLIVVRR
jgi:hypothetical protein